MPMEHRLCERQSTQMAVRLARVGHSSRTSIAANVSNGGMAIDNTVFGLRYGVMVNVTLLATAGKGDSPQQFHALVVHASVDSAGLMFVRRSA